MNFTTVFFVWTVSWLLVRAAVHPCGCGDGAPFDPVRFDLRDGNVSRILMRTAAMLRATSVRTVSASVSNVLHYG